MGRKDRRGIIPNIDAQMGKNRKIKGRVRNQHFTSITSSRLHTGREGFSIRFN
jgi:hypothetical protein